jgi:hypothetical protein
MTRSTTDLLLQAWGRFPSLTTCVVRYRVFRSSGEWDAPDREPPDLPGHRRATRPPPPVICDDPCSRVVQARGAELPLASETSVHIELNEPPVLIGLSAAFSCCSWALRIRELEPIRFLSTRLRLYPLVPESRRDSVVSALYALNTYPQWRFPERVQCISIVTHVILDSGGLCKLALRHTTTRVPRCHAPRDPARSTMVIIQDACPRVSPARTGQRYPSRTIAGRLRAYAISSKTSLSACLSPRRGVAVKPTSRRFVPSANSPKCSNTRR